MVFRILGIMQWYWYSNDRRRERFVSICRDRDVQRLTWDAYMNKQLVMAKPIAHVKIFLKNIAQGSIVSREIGTTMQARGCYQPAGVIEVMRE